MRDGKVEQHGTPEEVYEAPISPAIAARPGDVLILPAQLSGNGDTLYPLSVSGLAQAGSENGYVVIRPEEIRVSTSADMGVEGSLIHIDYYGHDAMLTVSVAQSTTPIKARVAGPADFTVGQKVYLQHLGPVRYFSRQ